jgi:hypothetical protein
MAGSTSSTARVCGFFGTWILTADADGDLSIVVQTPRL